MSGTNPVSTWTDPVNTTQDAATYKAALDGAAQVAKRLVDAFAPHQSSTPNMTVTLDAGAVLNGITLTEVAAQVTGAITAPTGSNKRIDRVVVDAATGVVSVITGTPTTGTPAAPALTSGKLPIAQVGTVASPLLVSTTAITNSMLVDERMAFSFIPALANRTITGTANQITVTNGDGVSGNPTLSLPSAITLPGSLTLAGLLDLGSTGQVQFPATQNASAGANVLDDYEEGTWTPSVSGTATYLTQTGTYTKIGRAIGIQVDLQINVLGTGNTHLINGLPFAAGTDCGAVVGLSSQLAVAVVSLQAYIAAAGANMDIRSRTVAGTTDAQNAVFGGNAAVFISGIYFV